MRKPKRVLWITLAVLAALLMVGALGGSALATPKASGTAPAAAVAPAVSTPAPADGDTVQQGDQTTPDTAAETAGTEAASTEAETSQEEPGDASLPGGGHADAPGQNVDHQFEGVE
jgi:hypothetical protein